jgi:hypothetical protein
MSAFTAIHGAASAFNESVMGETFSYTSLASSTTSGLVGVFNQAQAAFDFQDFSQRRTVDLTLVSRKTQWAAVVPENRGTVTYGNVGYTIDSIDGANTAGESCYTLQLKRLT